MKTVLVWDFPLRSFHWSLVALVLVSVASGLSGGNAMVWHERSGLAIVGLLAFRVVWGFVGSTHARFASFIRGPRAIATYLKGGWQGLGHNPLGALSVVGLLSVLIAQVGTGLIGNDDIAFNGPLFALVDKHVSDVATGWHKRIVWVLAMLVAAHLFAIVVYARVKNDQLVGPMITGRKTVEDHNAKDATGGGPIAVLLAVTIALGAVWMAAGGLLPPPPPPPPDVGF